MDENLFNKIIQRFLKNNYEIYPLDHHEINENYDVQLYVKEEKGFFTENSYLLIIRLHEIQSIDHSIELLQKSFFKNLAKENKISLGNLSALTFYKNPFDVDVLSKIKNNKKIFKTVYQGNAIVDLTNHNLYFLDEGVEYTILLERYNFVLPHDESEDLICEFVALFEIIVMLLASKNRFIGF